MGGHNHQPPQAVQHDGTSRPTSYLGHDRPPFKVQGSIRYVRSVPEDSGTPPLTVTPQLQRCRGPRIRFSLLL